MTCQGASSFSRRVVTVLKGITGSGRLLLLNIRQSGNREIPGEDPGKIPRKGAFPEINPSLQSLLKFVYLTSQ